MKIVVQKAVLKVVRPQIVRYECDSCHEECGTRANPKETWYGGGREFHYCKRKGCKEARP